ncbi:MAG: glyoxalase family protein [Solirubrobacteraceae bacterium]|jgi:glyoxalase family protein|nr:glyoxalase family protein [Solirubrobacteraceae bacterium]
MRLEGIHHVTAITGDAPGNVDFYTRVLGLRLAAKSVNQDDPNVYHLFYSDERGRAGSDITFFEYPGAPRGRAGAGMVHTVVWRVGSPEALDFWERRLRDEGLEVARDGDSVRFADPEGLGHELVVNVSGDEPLSAEHPEVPAEHALQGFDSVRAYTADPERSRALLEDVLGATPAGDATWEVRGERRGGTIRYEEPPAQPGDPGAGTVHHVAWGTTVAEHPRWRDRVAEAGVRVTPVIDRHYFHSIYFREPSGVLFEIADDGPGFTVDVPLEELGTKVILPPFLESRRAEIEARLTPLPDPRADRVKS